jgi:hypothetical protein
MGALFHKRWVLFALASSLGACAGPRVVDRFESGSENIELLELPDGKGPILRLGGKTEFPVANYANAHIEALWKLQGYALVLINGKTADCPSSFMLAVVKGNEARPEPLGLCGDSFSFELNRDRLLAKASNQRASTTWVFQNGVLQGPIEAAAPVPKPRPSRHSAEPRSGEAALRVSTPVGDDVVPPAIGVGPMPSEAKRRVELFHSQNDKTH